MTGLGTIGRRIARIETEFAASDQPTVLRCWMDPSEPPPKGFFTPTPPGAKVYTMLGHGMAKRVSEMRKILR